MQLDHSVACLLRRSCPAVLTRDVALRLPAEETDGSEAALEGSVCEGANRLLACLMHPADAAASGRIS